jgi:hypothetical protein
MALSCPHMDTPVVRSDALTRDHSRTQPTRHAGDGAVRPLRCESCGLWLTGEAHGTNRDCLEALRTEVTLLRKVARPSPPGTPR